MKTKNELRLVWNNPNPPKQFFFKNFIKWLCKTRKFEFEVPKQFRWWKTAGEKQEIMKNYLSKIFADYDYTTGEVNLFPVIRAEEKVKEMLRNGTFDYYFERWQMTEKHLARLEKMRINFERKRA